MYETNLRRQYNRPVSAQNYVNFGKVAIGYKKDAREEEIVLPAAGVLRPLSFRYYAENDNTRNPESMVFCSGNVFIVAGKRLGVLKHDEIPGNAATVITEGLFLLPLDTDATEFAAHTASSLTGLNGKTAYYIAELGKVSDQAIQAGFTGFPVGYFKYDGQFQDYVPMSGLWHAPVYIDPSYEMTNTAISNPAAATVASTAEIFATPAVSDFVGLSQNFTVIAQNTNPNDPVAPQNISWVIDSVPYPNAGFKITHTFSAAGAGKTGSVTVTTSGGTTKTVNFTLTVSASAAPSAFTIV